MSAPNAAFGALSATEAALGPITILVNNAGIGLFGAAHEKTEADWDRVLDTNLKGVFLVSRAVVPSMIRRGSGDIVTIVVAGSVWIMTNLNDNMMPASEMMNLHMRH